MPGTIVADIFFLMMQSYSIPRITQNWVENVNLQHFL